MVEYNTCPICHNRISVNRLRGADGVDENGDPVPFWTDDPLLTKRGLAGVDYKGTTPCRQLIMKELQDYYNQMELDMGLEQTNFTEVSKTAPFRRIHITELRSSTEKILGISGIPLADYFKYDRYGNDTSSTQIDWSDVDRVDGYPSILREKPIRAIYIEELRRGIYSIGYDTIFARDITWEVPDSDIDGGLGNIKKIDEDPDFFKNYLTHDVGLEGVADSLEPEISSWYSVIHQGKILHIFVPSGWYVEHHSNTDGNLHDDGDWSDWEDIKFDPILPELSWGPGITGIAIDETGVDYIMYTTEFFEQRIGQEPSAGYRYEDASNYIARYTYPKERILGNSNGSPNQEFDAGSKGIYTPIIENSEIIYVGEIAWTRVDDFNLSTKDSQHYVIDYNNGIIVFGDGVKGKIPPEGIEIKIFIILVGGGVWKFETIIVERHIDTFYDHLRVCNGSMWYSKKKNYANLAYVKRGDTITKLKGHHEIQTAPNGEILSENWLYRFTDATPISIQGTNELIKLYGPNFSLLDKAMVTDGYVERENPDNFEVTIKRQEDFGSWYDGVGVLHFRLIIPSYYLSDGYDVTQYSAGRFFIGEVFVFKEYGYWTGTHVEERHRYNIEVRNTSDKTSYLGVQGNCIKYGDLEGTWEEPIKPKFVYEDGEWQWKPFTKIEGDIYWTCWCNYFQKRNNESHVGWINPEDLLESFMRFHIKLEEDSGLSYGYPSYNIDYQHTFKVELEEIE